MEENKIVSIKELQFRMQDAIEDNNYMEAETYRDWIANNIVIIYKIDEIKLENLITNTKEASALNKIFNTKLEELKQLIIGENVK